MTAVLDPALELGTRADERLAHATAQRHRDIADGLVRAVAYADVFDFALTIGEAHRYLVGAAASVAEVEALLCAEPRPLDGRLSQVRGHVTLPGRESLVAERAARQRESARAWPRALRHGRALGSLPFVRMVALTGALAAGNARVGGDIDYLLVTATGRLWLARASAVAIVRYAARQGHALCPNYLVAETALEVEPHDLYAAHELAQMVPLTGHTLYAQMRAANPWAAALLPNATNAPRRPAAQQPLMPRLRALAEASLGSPLGSPLEAWERDRKVRRFREMAGSDAAEASFATDRCKGHFGSHAARIRAAYQQRARAAGVDPHWQVEHG